MYICIMYVYNCCLTVATQNGDRSADKHIGRTYMFCFYAFYFNIYILYIDFLDVS